MKRILLTAVTVGALFACSKQDVAKTEEVNWQNRLTLTVGQDVSSKGVDGQKEPQEYAVIGSAKIYFINASGNNIYQRELTADEIDALDNTSSTAGGNSITISGVPNTATTLYFIANIKTTAGTGYTMVEGTSSADARLRIDKLQADAIHVPMAGQSGTFTQVNGNQYSASVLLTPLVARIEVGQVTSQNQSGTATTVSSDITEYKLSGVFMNNIRSYVLLNGTPYLVGAPIDIKNQAGWSTGWANYFNSTNPVFPYYLGGSPANPSDWVNNSMVTYCNPDNSALTFYPDAVKGAVSTDPGTTPKKAWAYQVCPSTTVPVGTPADVPHLILKLTDVKYVNNDLGLPTQYVTVTKYKDNSNNPVTEFKRGNVYRIQNLTFTYNEATNEPYQQNISVTATVSVVPWVINNINPDWN